MRKPSSGNDNSLLTDQDMTTTGDNMDYSIPKWKQAMSVNINLSHTSPGWVGWVTLQ